MPAGWKCGRYRKGMARRPAAARPVPTQVLEQQAAADFLHAQLFSWSQTFAYPFHPQRLRHRQLTTTCRRLILPATL